jgi:DNA polymerase III epsilon subunit-like protein
MNKQWDENNKKIVGLPRPFFTVNKKISEKKKLHKKFPLPWQSEPGTVDFETGNFNLKLIQSNEDIVSKNNLCAYCGVKIEDNEDVIRWKKDDLLTGDKVPSDYHPFHKKCMKQARIYCPFMRKAEDKEFEFGKYVDLKKNFLMILQETK